MLAHPLNWIPEGQLRRWQVPLLIVAVVGVGTGVGLILPRREGFDLLALVEAGSADAARSVLSRWSHQERIRVAYSVGLDFLVNPAYMSVLAIACVWSGRRFSSVRLRATASLLAWLAWSVVLTNIVENIGLFIALSSEPVAPWPPLMAGAHYWATGVITATIVFSVAGLALGGRRAA